MQLTYICSGLTKAALGVAASATLIFLPLASARGATYGQNLIANPSFGTAGTSASLPANWRKGGSGTNDRLLTYPVAGRNDATAAKVQMTTRTTGDAKWYFDNVPAIGGETYAFSDYYVSDTASAVTVQFQLQDGSYKYVDLALGIPAAGEWTRFTKTFKVPTTYASPVQHMTIFHLINTVGALTVDDYELMLIDGDPPTVTVQPLNAGPYGGTVTLRADAADAAGVASVRFYVDGSAVGEPVTSPPYELLYDTATLSDGIHYFTATAMDVGGNQAAAAPDSFVTDNQSETLPASSVMVHLVVINDNGGGKGADDFPLFIDSVNVGDGSRTGLPPGSHVVSAINDPGYIVSYIGDCAPDGNMNVTDGQHLVCTIVNDDVAPEIDPAPSNVVPNPSVEQSVGNLPVDWFKGGWGTRNAVFSYPVAGHSGAKAMRVDITSHATGDAKWYFNPVPAQGGTTYLFSDYYKSNVPSIVTVQYKLADGTYKYVDIARDVPASSGWKQLTKTFTAPTNFPSPVVGVSVFHLINGVGWLTTDDFSLAPLISEPDPSGNLFANADLEDAAEPTVPAFWAKAVSPGSDATFTYPVKGRKGDSAARVTVSNYVSGAGAKWYPRSVPLTPNKDYMFSSWHKSTTDSVITAQVQMADGSYRYLELGRLTVTPNWEKFERPFTAPAGAVRVTVLHLIKSNGSLTVDDYSLTEMPDGSFERGMISLHFDDGPLSVFENAIPLLTEFGVTSSQSIITSYDDEPGHVNWQQIRQMSQLGHEITSHTRVHAHLTQINPIKAGDEIFASRLALRSRGYDADVFVYPFGEFTDAIEQLVKDAGYRGARSVYTGFNTKNTDPYALVDQHVEISTTIEDVRGWIDHAVANKQWLILELHDINDSGIQYSQTPEFLRQVLEYIVQSGIQVVSTSDGLAAMGH